MLMMDIDYMWSRSGLVYETQVEGVSMHEYNVQNYSRFNVETSIGALSHS